MKKTLLLSILFISSVKLSFSQTTLSPGDISLLWYSVNPTDEFGFITFVDLSVGTIIYFTDQGASSAGALNNPMYT